MKIVSIIGTRPQYIKIKPLYDRFKQNNVNHVVIDTLQHYSDAVSRDIINDLDLKIDYNVVVPKNNEIEFIANTIKELQNILILEKPDYILVLGDTNSTFCAGLVGYKLKIPVCHIEAGLRCGNFLIPEEINRIYADSVSTINFCSSPEALSGVSNGIFCGDLEYELLNIINPEICTSNYGVMTIHRQLNTNVDRLSLILQFCKSLEKEIIFPAHHRVKPLLNQVSIPDNIKIIEPLCYTEMVKLMGASNFIITDSGGIQKTSAFFGKRTLVFRKNIEWNETERDGFCKRFETFNQDKEWVLSPLNKRDKRLFLAPLMPSEIIYEEIFK